MARKARNGPYAEYKKIILRNLTTEYEKFEKNPSLQDSSFKYSLNSAKKQNEKIIFCMRHIDIYKLCKIPRSSYNDVIPKMIKDGLLLQISRGIYETHLEWKTYTMIAITKEHLTRTNTDTSDCPS